MPKGIFITYFDAVEGVVLKPEYTYITDKTRITNGLAQQLYFAHSTGETKDFLEMKIGNFKISSYYTGMAPKSHHQICLALVLDENEMGAAYREFLRIKAKEIVKTMDEGGEIRIRDIYKELERREKPVDEKHLMIRVLAEEETWKAMAAPRKGKRLSPSTLSDLKKLELLAEKQNGKSEPEIKKIRVFKAPSTSVVEALEQGRVPRSIRGMVGESVIYAIDELQRQIRQEMEEPPTEILEPLVNTTNYLITTTLDEEGIIPLKELTQRLGIEQKTILYHVKQLKNHLLADYTRGYVYQLLRIIVQVLPEENNIIGRIRKAVKNIQRKLSKLTRTNTQTL